MQRASHTTSSKGISLLINYSQIAFIKSSTVILRPFMNCLIMIWHFKVLPFIFERFADKATPQPEKTLSDAVEVALTHNHFRAVRPNIGNR